MRQNGHIVQLSEDAQSKDEQARKAINADKARRLGIVQGKYGSGVLAVARNGNALVKDGFDVQFWKDGKLSATIPQGARGYSWKMFCDREFHKLNGRDEVIGNISVATGCASSGGMSNPHSRYMPLLWRRHNGLPEDLNSHIDKASGWYLTKAIDINERGQILCLALQTDAKQAEAFNNIKNWQWIVLTPLK